MSAMDGSEGKDEFARQMKQLAVVNEDVDAREADAAKKFGSVAAWKEDSVRARNMAKKHMSSQSLADFASMAANLRVGMRCWVDGNEGEVAFLGEDIEELPRGFWVGVRYRKPVGKNDGTVKGRTLFECNPKHGHLVRPNKVDVSSSVSAKNPSVDGSPAVKSPSAGTRTSPSARDSKKIDKWSSVEPKDLVGSHPSVHETLPRCRVGFVYDRRMELHQSPLGFHPEQPLRLSYIYAELAQHGLLQRMELVRSRLARPEELSSVHTAGYVQTICSLPEDQKQLNDIASDMNSVFLCPESRECAMLAAGSVVEATKMVTCNALGRALCAVRPPGHHALPSCAMGFCIFGNVAVAAREAKLRQWAKRILIFDWDVHHGNGTQKMFLADSSVLFFSVHRHDRGSFYPGGPDGSFSTCGTGEGRGFTVNVAWPKPGAGDAEYLAVLDQLLLPIGREFRPDLVLISAGFDAAQGDPLGGCQVTPSCYYKMTQACMELAGGRVVLVLEGGYSLRATSQSVAACACALLRTELLEELQSAEEVPVPKPVFQDAIDCTKRAQEEFWRCLRTGRDEEGMGSSA